MRPAAAQAQALVGSTRLGRIGRRWAETARVLSALLMFDRFAKALKVAVRDEGFAQILGAGFLLVAVGTLTYTTSQDWNVVADSTSPLRR